MGMADFRRLLQLMQPCPPADGSGVWAAQLARLQSTGGGESAAKPLPELPPTSLLAQRLLCRCALPLFIYRFATVCLPLANLYRRYGTKAPRRGSQNTVCSMH